MAEKLSVKIYNSIKEEIENGKLDGRTFLSESETAKKYGVSKAPVRDAFHLLCSQGYLISYPRKGYMINVFSIDEINQIQEIRKCVEALSVKLTIQNATDEEIMSLKEYTKEQLSSDDPLKTNNSLFHMRLAQISKNKYLPGVLNDLVSKVSQAKINSQSNLEKHDRIIDAMLRRNTEEALACLEDDIMKL